MVIYNQTTTGKKYASGILMGALLIPAFYLFTQGYIFYGIALVIVYLGFETSRSGVGFDFGNSRFSSFREVLFFIKIPRGKSGNLDTFSHYRVGLQSNTATMSANWVQTSTVTQEHQTLELFNKDKNEFLEVVKSDVDQIQPLVNKLEEQNITPYFKEFTTQDYS